jgi:hypothetical protein
VTRESYADLGFGATGELANDANGTNSHEYGSAFLQTQLQYRGIRAIRQLQRSVARRLTVHGRTAVLPADLRQSAQPTDVHLQQRMLTRLLGQRLCVQRNQVFAAAQRITQVHLVVAEQAGA